MVSEMVQHFYSVFVPMVSGSLSIAVSLMVFVFSIVGVIGAIEYINRFGRFCYFFLEGLFVPEEEDENSNSGGSAVKREHPRRKT